ncbi:hypothetical protein HPB50_006340 [Hyalomma asiaticum]|uniref:Uncharacterized protein n=1 Tax=Hyalomma asiaticum TaxID=266040 RepID=A0ACB7RZJ0_HYAAI|nr:hypothetical protein HPB50_006340 [Hyalomma asiaticum]
MSCTEVMYQPYSPYFPYHQRAAAAAAASCPGAGAASGIAAAQAACLDYKRFVNPKMHDLLAGSTSPATPPSSLQSLGPPRSTSTTGSSSSHHSRSHHHNHHGGSGGTTANNSVNSSGNSSGPHGSSGRPSSSSSACAVVASSSSPSTPLAARSPDREEASVQTSKSASSSSSLPGGGHNAVVTGGGGSSPSSAVTGGTAAAPGDAHYVSDNCVVFTYYSGDISAVVDEHFSRALSESGAYDGTAGSSCKSGASQLKVAVGHRLQSRFTPCSCLPLTSYLVEREGIVVQGIDSTGTGGSRKSRRYQATDAKLVSHAELSTKANPKTTSATLAGIQGTGRWSNP